MYIFYCYRFRAAAIDIFTVDQVHLLPGYPKENGTALLVQFYVQMPAGFKLDVLPATALFGVVKFSQNDLEKAIGKTITVPAIVSEKEPATTKTTTPTAFPTGTSKKSSTWKWIVAGVCFAFVVVIIVLIIVCLYW